MSAISGQDGKYVNLLGNISEDVTTTNIVYNDVITLCCTRNNVIDLFVRVFGLSGLVVLKNIS